MELLKFYKNGQWELTKAEVENDFKSYRNLDLQGRLPEDYGTKGQLHNNSNSRPPRVNSKNKMAGRVPVPAPSAHADRNPGVGP